MQIKSNIAEYQINDILEILKNNKIKKTNFEYVKHLCMFAESMANARATEGASFDYDEFIADYKDYWRLT